jgi:hypothetical protein
MFVIRAAAVVFADELSNDLHGLAEATFEAMNLTASGRPESRATRV